MPEFTHTTSRRASIIARHFGVSRQAISRQLSHVLRRLVVLHEEQARQWIALESERLDEVWSRVYRQLDEKRPLVVDGKPVVADGKPVLVDPDPEEIRATAATLVKISQRRSKLLGLDAPKHIMLEHTQKKDERKRYDVRKLSVAQLRALRELQRAAAVGAPIDVKALNVEPVPPAELHTADAAGAPTQSTSP